ncbi:hypothetical protein A3D81_00470 [Candidatus Curtissbacteria bacterium RIFCSPHIGHO2_02_FULL_40_17]|uniref:Exosortase/archaeosortase family protein n=3 Tax=Microgenomates group TaxID=1794810 RepID=A0A1F7JTA9_9BACT|nr:MAG: hypothetical protein A3D81_00470 [Candidatus Curtissbacteria bacterium RIFCSPHIGHO2_02_FULL_40_17]OGE05413.1 MAG: hypothetical protein A3F45_03170 [Candidatus Curtissbacteria bacterium RIFCSPHIGHO2_12_FULL_41_17]OGK58845.1 MAG: hypothetical protein A3I56_00190 [Candidatus Roizmanbacteria bacterium RIFCSPLOWO2_02_FULL_43_10]
MQETRLIKTPFSRIIILAAVLLMTLPFIATFNEFLTNLFLKWELYRVLENWVVPYEAKLLAGILNVLGLGTKAVAKGVWVEGAFLEIQWNCLGWQSAVLLLASFLGGFQGKFSWTSRLEVVLIGFLGTFLVQFGRLSAVAILAVKVGTGVAIFFHDYLALILVILWFVVFWWFSYTFVLEESS